VAHDTHEAKLFDLKMKKPPIALSIAGSDNSAGAGAQADLKTFSANGIYGLTAITCVVAEVPGKVSAIQPVTPEIVRKQIRLSFESFPVASVKTGMLFSAEIIAAVCDELDGRQLPLVVDPVMVATSGDSLVEPDAVALCRERLLPMATLITPNLDEAAALLGRKITSIEQMPGAGNELTELFGTAILLKGGHLQGKNALDLLFADNQVHKFTAPFVRDVQTHGTGCTYSAAIAAGLAQGLPLVTAIDNAKKFVTRAIREHFRWTQSGKDTDALNHFL
jgi:hydroxymethylpyrimidine/phosphomethylpyrimidine kinase